MDVLEGRAVRLEQGDYDRVRLEGGDPLELVAAAARSKPPFVHVIALDAARDGGAPLELARDVVAAAAPVPVQLGGGVRSVADAVALADAGIARVLVGSAAFGPIPLEDFVAALGDRVVVAVDVAQGTVRTAGWLADSGLSPEDALLRCAEAGVERVLCTAIARDGTASGPDLDLIRRARAAFAGEILAAGGVRDQRDIEALADAGADGAVVGRAWLEGALAT
ncbi:MAG: phosphoribosylformimino-5-aminoimidazole carboxamide ribotide isomerase [Gaiellaceae bacterium]|nr:phosphoribosylformimino-5-aminoimidazole carboxamide ribotide isomerase [Gaiellaceae bacterium]